MSLLVEQELLSGFAATSSSMQTGAEVQQNPLPKGRYWFLATGEKWNPIGPPPFSFPNPAEWFSDPTQTQAYQLTVWLTANGDKVDIQRFENYPPLGPGGKPSVFIIFEVLSETTTPWPSAIGWPHDAPADIQTATDVGPSGGDDALGIPEWVPWAVGGTIGVIGLYALAKLVRG